MIRIPTQELVTSFRFLVLSTKKAGIIYVSVIFWDSHYTH